MWQIQFHICVQKLHSHNSERIIKIDPLLTKLCQKQKGYSFLTHSVEYSTDEKNYIITLIATNICHQDLVCVVRVINFEKSSGVIAGDAGDVAHCVTNQAEGQKTRGQRDRHTDSQTDADERFAPATVVGVRNDKENGANWTKVSDTASYFTDINTQAYSLAMSNKEMRCFLRVYVYCTLYNNL